MDSNKASGIDSGAAVSREGGADRDNAVIVGKRKYVPPHCHCLMTGDTKASKTTIFATESAFPGAGS